MATGNLRDYLKALEEIAALQASGKITFGDAVELNLAAATEKRAADEKVASEKAQAAFGEDGGLRDIIDGADRVKDAAYEAAQALGGDLVGAADALSEGLGSIFGGQLGSDVRGLLKSVTGENREQSEKLRTSISSLAKGVGISDDAATKIGKFGGKAIEGAATGALTNSFLTPIGKALGVKTSQTGAQVGGAIGQLGSSIPGIGPFLPVIGSVVGSLIGGAFKKTKSGAVTLTSADAAGTVTGNSSAAKKAAGGLADSVQASLNAIAEQLGGDVGKFNVTVGQRHGDYRVTTGTSLKVKSGAQDFNDDGAAAQLAAVRIAITQGAIVGLSAAMQKAIQSNDDVDKALSEALKVKELEELIGGLGSPQPFDSIYVGFTNLRAGSSWTIRSGDALPGTAVTHFTGPIVEPVVAYGDDPSLNRRIHLYRKLPAPVTARYVRIDMAQGGSSPPNVQAGIAVVNRCFQPRWPQELGGGRMIVDTAQRERLPGGGFSFDDGVIKDAFQFTLGDLSAAELQALYALVRRRGERRPVVLVEDPDDASGLQERIRWAVMDRLEPYERRGAGITRWALRVEDWA